jgi:UrcA family protein
MTMNTVKTSSALGALIAGAICVALSAGITAVATAAGSPDSYQITVNYRDLDASSVRGAAVLYSRIHSAAEKLCLNFAESDAFSKMRKEACVNKAIEGAVSRVGEPALLAVYYAHKGTPQPNIVVADRTR